MHQHPPFPSENEFLSSDELLQLNLPAAHKAKSRIHGSRTVHLPLVKAPHGVGVIEVHSLSVVIQAYADTLRHGQHAIPWVARRCVGAGDGGGGRRLRDEEFAHAQGEEGERLGEVVARVLTAAVVSTVMVIPAESKHVNR